VTSPPKLLRACINYKDSTVSISWKAPIDICGSFTEYRIYAKENAGTYNLLDIIPDISVIEYPHKLSDQNTTWKYYITVLHLCNGLDSATSDTITVDVTKPPVAQLDSVSYSLDNQDIIAGWTKNPALDTRGYKIFDYSTNNADSIGITSLTSFTVSKNPATRFPTVITTFDSCNISSLRSEPHTPAFLSKTIDTCQREIYLSWQLYNGWNIIEKQNLLVSKNGSPFIVKETFSGSLNTFTYNDFILGDNLVFYVRSFTNAGLISSSSNQIKVETRALVVPDFLYLETVSVTDIGDKIDISWHCENIKDVIRYDIYRSNDNVTFNQELSKTTNNPLDFSVTDPSADPNKQSYFYQVDAINKCEEVIIQSEISQSIFLTITPMNDHNEYINWDGGVKEYWLTKKTTLSTWNTLESSSTTIIGDDYTDSLGCYRIVANESLNQYAKQAQSLSNIVCSQLKLTAYVTTAINPNSDNNQFVVKGQGIDHDKSSFQIYNRWGEKIADMPTDQTWKGTFNGSPVQSGVYVYIVKLTGLLGETETQKGIVNVLK
jgi:gliding motility-associated-like protein